MQQRIFICDDEEGMRRYLDKMLSNWGFQVELFADPRQLILRLQQAESCCDLLLLDVKMPEMDGIEVLTEVRKNRPELPILMMTGHGTIESAVEAMKLGAYDYLAKPFPREKLFALLTNALEQHNLLEENRSLKQELKKRRGQMKPIFVSEAFQKVYDFALQAAASDATVLIRGESGTGKELIANAVHNASPRAKRRLVTINCAALSDTLLESQLFGHIKGAFTGAVQNQKGLFEEADGGTLVLDEVGDISPNLQVKLLRMLQEGEFLPVGATQPRYADVRIVAMTNKDLEAQIAAGHFRDDLYYRLNVLSLELPPLRNRKEDLPILVEHFITKIATKMNRPLPRLAPGVAETLTQYDWPGNVRELENIIERAIIVSPEGVIEPVAIPFSRAASTTSQPASVTLSGTAEITEAISLREAEQIQIRLAMRQTENNKTRAAAILGITRKTIDRKIKEYQIDLTKTDD